MPSVTYNGQSFAIDGRRIWILGASLQYARIPAPLWRSRIAAARQAGFNTIETAAVWSMHEPRKGRFVFDEHAGIRKFIELCAAESMRVILRVGPFIGSDFDAGGLPGWLVDIPGIALRESNEVFLEHVSRYFRKLLGEISDLQATGDGPIILVQSEHAWSCSNQPQADKYLHELTRFIRESGVTVPVINANDLWQESPGTIDTWRGHEHMLFQLRQLRTVQPAAPRLVSEFIASRSDTWGADTGARSKGKPGAVVEDFSAAATLEQFAEVLAAGGQAVVSPFHGGSNFGFLGGRRAGMSAGGFVLTAAGGDAPLGEAGERGEKYNLIKRLVTFAGHFSGLFTELDPEYQPIALDPHETLHGTGPRDGTSVVSVRGSQGRAVFVFGRPGDSQITLVLDDGLRLPVILGDQSVTWTALNADLQGAGRLEYSNICPWAVVDRAIVIFHGPAKAPVFISIDGGPLETTVPADGAKPLVIDHHGLTVVILNRAQIDAAYINGTSVYVGIAGIDVHGRPIPARDWPKPWVISAGARIESLAIPSDRASRSAKDANKAAARIGDWHATPASAYVNGTSPRFASLDGPATLSDCGAPAGYGWYRVRFSAGGRHLLMLPQSGDRLHLHLEGRALRLVGAGPGAKSGAFEVKLEKGEHTLVALADNFGRFAQGNDLGRRKGLFGHVFSVKEVRGKARLTTGKAVTPFELRGFIEGRSAEQLSDVAQAVWTFEHPRKTPIIIEVRGAETSGTFVLNDKPIAYYAGVTGAMDDRIVLDPDEHKALKRGRNVLRFAPDHGAGSAEELAGCTTIFEAVENLTEKADWSFAKWEPPAAMSKSAKSPAKEEPRPARGTPSWWRAGVEVDAATAASERPLWLHVNGLSKGQAFINGHNLGRYFIATGEGKPVGPQTRLYVPTPWLKSGTGNELLLFDEHGFEPHKVRIT